MIHPPAGQSVTVLDPTSGPHKGGATMALRTGALEGAVVSVIWNGRQHGDKVLRAVVATLSERWGCTMGDFLQKKFIGNMAPSEYFEGLTNHRPDFVIAGVGD